MHFDDSNEEPFLEKLYATKEDCQISLDIYAIKEHFYFRQTQTTRHYFVLSCHDTTCDWRILAKELTNCGYYTSRRPSFYILAQSIHATYTGRRPHPKS